MSRPFEKYLPFLKKYFAELKDVTAVYLFGSYARGQAGPLSDIDFALLLDPRLGEESYFETRLKIGSNLQRIMEQQAIDVAILNQAPLALAYRVLRDGVLVYCRDNPTRIAFTARTINAYLDFKPILQRHARAILERARQGELLDGYNPYRGALERHRQLRERLEAT